MTDKHTLKPWYIDECFISPSDRSHIVCNIRNKPKGEILCTAHEDCADIIVKCVNEHEATQARVNELEQHVKAHVEAANSCEGEVRVLRKALKDIMDLDGEINPSNFNEDDALYLNSQFIEAFNIAEQALKKGESGE